MNVFDCRVCGSTEMKASYLARELMFGTRQEFEYVECASCRSLQISEIPNQGDLSTYYPRTYYAHSDTSSTPKGLSKSALLNWLVIERDKSAAGRFSPLGAVLEMLQPTPLLQIVRAAKVSRDQRIIDVGCGRGGLLHRLANAGFRESYRS